LSRKRKGRFPVVINGRNLLKFSLSLLRRDCQANISEVTIKFPACFIRSRPTDDQSASCPNRINDNSA
jgi:hypothetical protein